MQCKFTDTLRCPMAKYWYYDKYVKERDLLLCTAAWQDAILDIAAGDEERREEMEVCKNRVVEAGKRMVSEEIKIVRPRRKKRKH